MGFVRHIQRRPAPAPDPLAVAAEGTAGSGQALPHAEQIQKSFGRHDISDVQAYSGGAAQQASEQLGAEAFATGNKVAFARRPSVHTAAHEAAHVVQQRAGVALKGGMGQAGDRYEQHADAVADRVVRGQSAEGLLDQFAGRAGGAQAVQGFTKEWRYGTGVRESTITFGAKATLFQKDHGAVAEGVLASTSDKTFRVQPGFEGNVHLRLQGAYIIHNLTDDPTGQFEYTRAWDFKVASDGTIQWDPAALRIDEPPAYRELTMTAEPSTSPRAMTVLFSVSPVPVTHTSMGGTLTTGEGRGGSVTLPTDQTQYSTNPIVQPFRILLDVPQPEQQQEVVPPQPVSQPTHLEFGHLDLPFAFGEDHADESRLYKWATPFTKDADLRAALVGPEARYVIHVSGLASRPGSDGHNQRLARRRADWVRGVLRSVLGDQVVINVASSGERASPIADHDDRHAETNQADQVAHISVGHRH